jgi:hypothetical protein
MLTGCRLYLLVDVILTLERNWDLQMNTWPIAPHIAKPRTSYQTLGCLAMNASAPANSPPDDISMPRY